MADGLRQTRIHRPTHALDRGRWLRIVSWDFMRDNSPSRSRLRRTRRAAGRNGASRSWGSSLRIRAAIAMHSRHGAAFILSRILCRNEYFFGRLLTTAPMRRRTCPVIVGEPKTG